MNYEIIRKVFRESGIPDECHFESEEITKLIKDKQVVSMEHSIVPVNKTNGVIEEFIETFVFLVQKK